MSKRVTKKKVNMIDLKKIARQEIPNNWPLRRILLDEPDELPLEIFAARFSVYWKLIAIKGGR